MTFNWTRAEAILRKELVEYRRNRFVVVTMTILPLMFTVLPTIQLFTIPDTAPGTAVGTRVGLSLLYMLLVPATVPSALSAYSVVGERDQGTLEPVLTTPIRREEFLTGKALAVLIPTLVVAYGIFGVFLTVAALFAPTNVVTAVFDWPRLLVQVLFTPLLAGWSIWVGIAISTRSRDVRAAQQLGTLASLPPFVVVALMALDVITPSLRLTLGLAAALLLVDGLGWRFVAAMFDRERLVTGGRA